MPISKERFENLDDGNGPTPSTNAATILTYLRDHPDMAFSQSEIADETGVKPGSVGPTLVRLRDRGRVDHRGHYWRVSDHDMTVDAATGHSGATIADRERDGETPNMGDWQEHAVDPREHR